MKKLQGLLKGGFASSRIFFVAVFLAIILVSVLVGAFAGAAAAINIFVFCLLAIAIPYFIYRFFQFKRVKSYEEQFPAFLRDLSSSLYAGLSLIQAIQSTATSDYGELTKEIRKMNNQISWNIPLEKILHNFSRRMRKSEVISRSLMVISQAQKSGGSMESILGSLADNIEKIREVENEKNSLLGQQVTMMYAIFFIFIGISITLIMFLVPLLQSNAMSQMGAIGGIGGGNVNPCQTCIGNNDVGCFSCSVLFHISNTFSFGGPDNPKSYYKSLFFLMVIIQGVCSGLVAGQIGSESVIAGIKHSLIMSVSGFAIFLVISGLGLI